MWVVTVRKDVVPPWKKLAEWTTRLRLVWLVVVSVIGLGHCLNRAGAIRPICLLAYRVSRTAVISNLHVLWKLSL